MIDINNQSIENSEVTTKRFNIKSFIIVLNYFLTPILFFIIVCLLFRFTLIDEIIFDLQIVKNFCNCTVNIQRSKR